MKVNVLVEEEKRTRERQRLAEEQEAQEELDRQREMLADHERANKEAAEGEKDKNERNEEHSASGSVPAAQKMAERSGLCVICQDEEANIAIVDCGHLALCRGCSDMVMSSSRECPLCRTRIVTEARLLRIFKS